MRRNLKTLYICAALNCEPIVFVIICKFQMKMLNSKIHIKNPTDGQLKILQINKQTNKHMFIFTFYKIFQIWQSFAISTTVTVKKRNSFKKLTDSLRNLFSVTINFFYRLVAALSEEHMSFSIYAAK